MEIRALKPYLTLTAIFAATALLLAFTVNVQLADTPGINKRLPTRAGKWTGKELRFCQNARCDTPYTVDALPPENKCSTCGTALGTKMAGEATGLPEDTEILKAKYEDGSGIAITAGYVLSGKERVSIHRPEVCMRGGGNTITGQRFVRVDIPGRKAKLEVKILLMQQEVRNPAEGTTGTYYSYYAYWFVGDGVETSRHLVRMFRMSFDRVFFSRAHRWAYIMISGPRDPASEESWLPGLTQFISDFYPQLVEGIPNRVQ